MDNAKRKIAQEKREKKNRANNIRGVLAKGLVLGIKPSDDESIYINDVDISKPLHKPITRTELFQDDRISQEALKKGIIFTHKTENNDEEIRAMYSEIWQEIDGNISDYHIGDYESAAKKNPIASKYIELGKILEDIACSILDFFAGRSLDGVVSEYVPIDQNAEVSEDWNRERVEFYGGEWRDIVEYFGENNRWANMTQAWNGVRNDLRTIVFAEEPTIPQQGIRTRTEQILRNNLERYLDKVNPHQAEEAEPFVQSVNMDKTQHIVLKDRQQGEGKTFVKTGKLD